MNLHITEYNCFLECKKSKKFVFAIIGNKINSIYGFLWSHSVSADYREELHGIYWLLVSDTDLQLHAFFHFQGMYTIQCCSAVTAHSMKRCGQYVCKNCIYISGESDPGVENRVTQVWYLSNKQARIIISETKNKLMLLQSWELLKDYDALMYVTIS